MTVKKEGPSSLLYIFPGRRKGKTRGKVLARKEGGERESILRISLS